jgi:hypothetical protein
MNTKALGLFSAVMALIVSGYATVEWFVFNPEWTTPQAMREMWRLYLGAFFFFSAFILLETDDGKE